MPRQTVCLELFEVQKIQKSGWASAELGTPFNTFMTLNLENTGYTPQECHQAWRRTRQYIRRIHQRHNMPWIYLWVFEGPSSNGLHVHCLLHKTSSLTGQQYRKAVKSIAPLRGMKSNDLKIAAFHKSRPWTENMTNLLNYMCKGIRGVHAELIDRRPDFQGVVPGKRWGRSRNLVTLDKSMKPLSRQPITVEDKIRTISTVSQPD